MKWPSPTAALKNSDLSHAKGNKNIMQINRKKYQVNFISTSVYVPRSSILAFVAPSLTPWESHKLKHKSFIVNVPLQRYATFLIGFIAALLCRQYILFSLSSLSWDKLQGEGRGLELPKIFGRGVRVRCVSWNLCAILDWNLRFSLLSYFFTLHTFIYLLWHLTPKSIPFSDCQNLYTSLTHDLS